MSDASFDHVLNTAYQNARKELGNLDSQTMTINSLSECYVEKCPFVIHVSAWDDVQASRYIESVLLGLPVGQLVLQEGTYSTFFVIDGWKRVTAINDFIYGRLRLTGLKKLHVFNDLTFSDLPGDIQAEFLSREVPYACQSAFDAASAGMRMAYSLAHPQAFVID